MDNMQWQGGVKRPRQDGYLGQEAHAAGAPNQTGAVGSQLNPVASPYGKSPLLQA
jgi:hypothetical protein